MGASTDSRTSTRNLDRAFFTNVLKGAGMQQLLRSVTVRGASTRHSVAPQLSSLGSMERSGPQTTAVIVAANGGCAEPAMDVVSGSRKLPSLWQRTVTVTRTMPPGGMTPAPGSHAYSPTTVVWGSCAATA